MTTARDITIYQGQEFTLSLDYAGATGRAQVMHIRLADSTATVVQILTHNGAANSRVIYNDATQKLDITIGATVSDAWVVLADRVEWVFDIKDYEPGSEDGAVIPYRGKVILRGTRTRPSDVTPSPQMPSGDGRYTRFDGEQNLTPEQMAQAQINILGEEYAPGGGSGDVVGPASATDDRIAAFDGVTGKLIKQGGVTATAVASHLSSTSNPHSVTAAQVGADATGTAAAAVVAHAGATDPHGDRAYADGLAGNYAAAGHNHSGTYQPLATVLTNTTAAFTTAQETKLSGIEAAADVTDAGNVGTAIDGATAKTTPVDADTVALIDSAAGNVLKKLSWANIKATAKTYFDTLYQAASATLTTWAGITPGTGVATAIGTNVGTAGSVVTNGGALGTPSSGNLANCTGYPGGSGDVAGPASSTDNAVARFDSTTGKLLQNTTNVTIADTGALAITPDANAKAITVASHTHTTSNPAIDVAQTWNEAGVAFTAEKTNVTNTASAAGSLLRDWQVGGTTVANITKTGKFVSNPTVNTDFFSGQYAGTEYVRLGYGGVGGYGMFQTGANNGFAVSATPTIYASGAWTSSTTGATFLTFSNASSTAPYVTFEAVGLTTKPGIRIKQSTSTTALPFEIQLNSVRQMAITPAGIVQTFGAYTDDSNYVRGALSASSTAVTLAAETAGTGANDVPVVISPAGVSQVEVGNGVQFTEMTAPSAPAANKVILFAQDNGAGKTQLMALFASGAAQVVATEP